MKLRYKVIALRATLYKYFSKRQSRKELIKENTGLRKNLKMYLASPSIPLSQSERIMIKGALKHSGFVGWVQEPKTKHRYRILYRELLLKIKRSIHS